MSDHVLFYKQLTIEYSTNFDNMFRNENFKKQFKIHEAIWKNKYFKFAEFDMLRHLCFVSTYPQLYDRDIKNSNVTTSLSEQLWRNKW